ncbi:MAG: RNA polymerase sigma factor [Verrucomicrobia bacterium]|nr:RNA polymerase sigma factor [Verrucomicrobiota bacterium]
MVNRYYEPLYRFALSLTQREEEACDLTQETFYRWASKGTQLRDRSKAKTWLFTTLYREHLGSRRRQTRFPHYELETVDRELPATSPEMVREMDGAIVLRALRQVEETYRAPLSLFYLEDHSYREIAEILEIPIGTVMSRLSRGKAELRRLLADSATEPDAKIIAIPQADSGMAQES